MRYREFSTQAHTLRRESGTKLKVVYGIHAVEETVLNHPVEYVLVAQGHSVSPKAYSVRREDFSPNLANPLVAHRVEWKPFSGRAMQEHSGESFADRTTGKPIGGGGP